MKNLQLGTVALGLGLVVLVAGCGGGGGGGGTAQGPGGAGPLELPDPRAVRCNLSPEVCRIAPVYDDSESDRLVLSPNGLDATFVISADASNLASPLASSRADLEDVDDYRKALGDLVLAGSTMRLDGGGAVAASYQQKLIYCENEIQCDSGRLDISVAVTPYAYDYYYRYPGVAATSDRDIAMSRFAVLQSTKNSDYIVFGVAATMTLNRRKTFEEVTITARSNVHEVLGKPNDRVGGYTLTAAAYRRPGEVVDAVTLTVARRPGEIVGGYTLTAARNIGDVVGGFTLTAAGKVGDIFNGVTLTAAGSIGDVVGAVTNNGIVNVRNGYTLTGTVEIVGGYTLTAAGSIGDVVNAVTLTAAGSIGDVVGGYTLTSAKNIGDIINGVTLTAALPTGHVLGGYTLTMDRNNGDVVNGYTLTMDRNNGDVVNEFTITSAGNIGDVVGGYTLTTDRNIGDVVGGYTLTSAKNIGDIINGVTLTAALPTGSVVGGYTLTSNLISGAVVDAFTLTAAGRIGEVVDAITITAAGNVGEVIGGYTLTAAGSIGDVVNGYTLTMNRDAGYVINGITLTSTGTFGEVFRGYTLTSARSNGDIIGGVTLTARVRVIGGTTLTAAKAIGDIVNGYTLTAAGEVGDVIGGYTLTAFRNPGEIVGGEILTMTLFGDVIGIRERVTTYITRGPNVYGIYQLGAFVSGPRYDETRMPLAGRAAYRGFANAFAQSSNRNFLPFATRNGVQENKDGSLSGFTHGTSNTGTGSAAMVFSFDTGGARFQSGYIDLYGDTYADTGGAVVTQGPLSREIDLSNGGTIPEPNPVGNRFSPLLRANFANTFSSNPRYHRPPDPSKWSASLMLEAERRDNGRRLASYEPNTDGRFEFGDQRGGQGQASGLRFRLLPNDATAEETLDFKMVLVESGGSCYIPSSLIDCVAAIDPDSTTPQGGGVVRFYGDPATLTNKGDLGDRAPTFAAGVWQFNDIIYVGPPDGSTAFSGFGDKTRLVAVVDLIGTIGGIIFDAPPGP